LKDLIINNADKRLFLHEINLDNAITIYDKKIGFYDVSQKYVAFRYAMYNRFSLTFMSGIFGGLICIFHYF